MKKSGSLGLHEGLISDHTMQWADFEVTGLFGGQLYNPVLPSERQFMLSNIKKQEFQAKLIDLLERENVSQKVEPLVKDFELQWTNTANDETKIKLVARYQKLDDTITKSMLSAVYSIGKRTMGTKDRKS